MKGLQMKYFVLKPGGNDVFAKASRVAMIRYAGEIMDTDRGFALDIIKWVGDEEALVEKEKEREARIEKAAEKFPRNSAPRDPFEYGRG